MAPGPELGAALASLDVHALSGHDRVVVLEAHQRMAAHHAAHGYEAMVAVADAVAGELGVDDPEVARDAAAAEIRVALRLTRRAADAELALAVDLQQRVPRVLRLLAAGEIDSRRARVLVNGTSHVPPETAREVVEGIAERAPGLTTGQLTALLKRLCIAADPDAAARRYHHAVADRRVWSEQTGSGTANIYGLDLPPDLAAAATCRINRIARALRREGESRTMDQLRADVLLDLLLDGTAARGVSAGSVDLRVDVATLAGLSESPGELAGLGPVIADVARQVAERQDSAGWRWTVTDPGTGLPLDTGTTARRPSTIQRRRVEATNPTCVFPGCRMPGTDCDLDHSTPWSDGGPTTDRNLAPLCRHDHRIKTCAGWTYRPIAGGDHQWTTALGHTYTTSGLPP